MKKCVDKSKYGNTAFAIFAIHTILCLVSIICTSMSNIKVFHFGFNLAGFLLIVYPIVGGAAYLIVSIIGMVRNKKVIPYLICPVLSVFMWLILMGSVVVYV